MGKRFCYLDTLHPFVILLFFVSVIFPTMFTQNPVILIISFVGALLFKLSIASMSEIKSLFKLIIPVVLIISITNPLFSHNGETPLLFVNDNPITFESLMCGIDISIMISASIIWFSSFNSIMTTDKLLCLFSRRFAKIGLVISSALRFIPRIKKDYLDLYNGNRLLYINKKDGIIEKLLFSIKIFSAVIIRTLENAIITAETMIARGYSSKRHKGFSMFKYSTTDYILGSVFVSLLILALVLFGFGTATYSFYPIVDKMPLTSIDIFCYICFTILSFLPFILQIKESLKWKYCELKI